VEVEDIRAGNRRTVVGRINHLTAVVEMNLRTAEAESSHLTSTGVGAWQIQRRKVISSRKYSRG